MPKEIIDSSICATCSKRECTGKELARLGFKKLKCPINRDLPKEEIKKVVNKKFENQTSFNL